MSVLESLELRAQLEARRALGARTLVAWAIERLPLEPPSRARAECVRAALVEAVLLADLDAIAILVSTMAEGPRLESRALIELAESGAVIASPSRLEGARRVLEELVRLEPTVIGLQALAGVQERLGHTDAAIALLARTASRADGLADVEGAARARVELTRLLVRAERGVEALEVVMQLERGLEPHARAGARSVLDTRDELVIAAAELGASGRYRRVRGLDRLVAIVERSPTIARAALRLLARHVERMGRGLTPLEVDRARSAITAARRTSLDARAIEAVERALERVGASDVELEVDRARALASHDEGRALLERARAVRDGGTAGPEPEATSPLRRPWLALSVIVQLRARRVGEALRAIREIERAGGEPDVLAWTMLESAVGERALRETSVSLASRWLGRGAPIGPARGYLHLAVQLERAGLSDLAGLALRRARDANEADARALCIQHAIRAAWRAHARGELDEAHRLLVAAHNDAPDPRGPSDALPRNS